MKAVVKEAKRKLIVKEVDMPQRYEEDDVLIRVSKVGICASDLTLWKLEDRNGLIMGHEFCGVVVDPGSSEFKKGERVVVIPKGPRGYDSTPGIKAPGAYAEYFFAAAKFVRRLPDTIDDNTANMIEPIGIAYNALSKADVKLGDKVLVAGAGIIGLLSAAWAKAMGAKYVAITEVNEKRLDFAKKHSEADEVLDANDPDIPKKLMENSKGGFDKVIECTAAEPSIDLCLEMIKPSGKLMLVGVTYRKIPINTLKVLMKNIEIEGVFGSSIVFDKVIDLLAMNLFDTTKYITKEISLYEVPEIFKDLTSGKSEDIKIVVTP